MRDDRGRRDAVRVANHVGVASIELTLDLVDATVIRRRRRNELSPQFDRLETRCAEATSDDA